MAGILIAMQKKIDVRGINAKTLVKRNDELDKLCEEIYNHRADVDGYKQKEADLIEGDIVNLAKAISISNYVNDLLIRNNAKKVKAKDALKEEIGGIVKDEIKKIGESAGTIANPVGDFSVGAAAATVALTGTVANAKSLIDDKEKAIR